MFDIYNTRSITNYNNPQFIYLNKMQAAKTGLVYDPRMTQHKSKRKHPQRPQRVKFIMKMLEQKFYTNHPRVEFISTINRVVTDENIRLVHPQKYIKHVTTLWPKTSHRSDITVLDTYFNEKTQKCAKLAIGGVLDGIDKIMAGQWENGFACVRPPGHHSGGRHTINGFCVYNNVAIGARYLLQHHKVGKVAIVDWDVHHGDGTQHVFQKQKNIMLISIHRYDRGTFYPGTQFGDVRNQGQAEGQGSKLNLPLDHVDEGFKEYPFQSPGDNEYIYLYHRIIQPVLKQFKPDFILVSSGFDAARGDPLGGFTVTPNGYYYMTKKLLEFQKPVLVVLEGGYNLQSISLSAAAVMRALVHDQTFPQQMQVAEKQVKYKCQLMQPVLKQIDQMIQILSKNWSILNSQQLKSYSEIVKSNEKRVFGIVKKEQSSSSSQEEDETDNISENSVATNESGHRYNTRSKARTAQKQLEKELETKELEKQKKQWEKQVAKMKKNEKATQKQTEKIQKGQKKPGQKGPQLTIEKQQLEITKKEGEKKIVQKKSQKKEKKEEIKDKKQVQVIDSDEQKKDGSVIKQFYFAAGHLQKFKDFSLQNQKIRKITYPQQVKFYQNATFEKQFIPKYYGKEGEDCIIIENLLYHQENPIIIDVKLSKQSNNVHIQEQKREKERKKEEKSTTQQYGFRISGYTTPEYKEGGLLQKGDDHIKTILKNVVTLENKQQFCDFLKGLSHGLNNSSRRYFGSSILLIKGPKKSEIRWVDFHYWYETNEGPDLQMIKGVNNLHKFIQQLQVNI